MVDVVGVGSALLRGESESVGVCLVGAISRGYSG